MSILKVKKKAKLTHHKCNEQCDKAANIHYVPHSEWSKYR